MQDVTLRFGSDTERYVLLVYVVEKIIVGVILTVQKTQDFCPRVNTCDAGNQDARIMQITGK